MLKAFKKTLDEGNYTFIIGMEFLMGTRHIIFMESKGFFLGYFILFTIYYYPLSCFICWQYFKLFTLFALFTFHLLLLTGLFLWTSFSVMTNTAQHWNAFFLFTVFKTLFFRHKIPPTYFFFQISGETVLRCSWMDVLYAKCS